MPGSINEAAQKKRRRGAWQSAAFASFWLMVAACALLYLRHAYVPEGIASIVMLVVALLDLGMIIPILILLKIRLKEIEGGEEDAAAQY